MSKKEESLGTITKNRAVKIFEALGFKTAGKWDVARLQKKIVKLDTLIEGAELDSKTLKRVNEILRAQTKGRKVAVVDPDDAAADKQRDKGVKDAAKREVIRKAEKKGVTAKKEKSDEKKDAKKAKATKKQEKRIVERVKGKNKKVVSNKKKAETDNFGSRQGTIKFAINAVLTKRPKTMQQILKDAKVKNQQTGHLKDLIDAGYVKKGDKGYVLA